MLKKLKLSIGYFLCSLGLHRVLQWCYRHERFQAKERRRDVLSRNGLCSRCSTKIEKIVCIW